MAFNKGNRIQHCKIKYTCAICSRKRENSIYEKDKDHKEIKNEDNNETAPTENVIMQVTSKSHCFITHCKSRNFKF